MEAADINDEEGAIAFVLERTDARNGDDAAVLRAGTSATCVSVDSTIEGVHVPRGCPPLLHGRRAVARALSDLAAMGAAPLAVTCAVHVPAERWPDAAEAMEGAIERAGAQGAPVVGGDFSSVHARELALVVTVIGVRASSRAGFVTRAGGCPGDLLVVTGSLGAALLAPPGAAPPEPPDRLRAGRALAPHVRSMVDVSDGLVRDVRHLARGAGCTAHVELLDVPLADPSLDPRDAAAVGDDYELLAAIAPDRLEPARAALVAADLAVPLTIVGRLADGHAGELSLLRAGKRIEAPSGFLHT
ncbi:MAG: thiamine-monophosphate kinase [Thermoleophilia bacterium]|nr:thiamine-monophosphate kinase [Thermoleophilia bacterium]